MAAAICQVLAVVQLVGRQFHNAGVAGFDSAASLAGYGVVAALGAFWYTSDVSVVLTDKLLLIANPMSAKERVPLLASMSDNLPTAWASYYFDLQFLTMMTPVGIYFCFKNLSNDSIFLVLYALTSVYSSGAVLKMMMVLSPAACILSGIAISSILQSYLANIEPTKEPEAKGLGAAAGGAKKPGKLSQAKLAGKERRLKEEWSMNSSIYGNLVVVSIVLMLVMYSMHAVWVSSEAYSSAPHVITASKGKSRRGGPPAKPIMMDDFQQGYRWLKENTPEDAVVLSWWDYGYRITAMANRTNVVDNSIWNASHVAQVGLAMASTEDRAFSILRTLDVSYIVVVFGGHTGYASDDLSKLLWMIRIGKTARGGRHLKEKDYFSKMNQFLIDQRGSPNLLNSFLYKLSYFRFGTEYTAPGQPTGYDRARSSEIGNKDYDLDTVDEVFTSERWLVRIYKVKNLDNRGSTGSTDF